MPSNLPKVQGGPIPWTRDDVPPTLEELRARRLERREVNKRVDELKTKLFRMTEGHMEQTVRVIRGWLKAAD